MLGAGLNSSFPSRAAEQSHHQKHAHADDESAPPRARAQATKCQVLQKSSKACRSCAHISSVSNKTKTRCSLWCHPLLVRSDDVQARALAVHLSPRLIQRASRRLHSAALLLLSFLASGLGSHRHIINHSSDILIVICLLYLFIRTLSALQWRALSSTNASARASHRFIHHNLQV